MKTLSVCTVICATLALPLPAGSAAGGLVVEGQIVSYECGDNCYLTIRTDYGKEIAGLCAAPECDSWNKQSAMPGRFRGKRVSASIAKGTRVDGNLDEVDNFPAFSRLRFGK